jgi:hypothetical protein
MSEALKGMKWLKTTLLESPDQDISPCKLVGAPRPGRAPAGAARTARPCARALTDSAAARRRVRVSQAQLLEVSLQEATCVVSDGYHRTAAVLARDSLDAFREEFPGVWCESSPRAPPPSAAVWRRGRFGRVRVWKGREARACVCARV